MQKISTLYTLLIALFAVSCASRIDTTEPVDLSNGGAIRLSVDASSALTKLSKVPTPSPDEFHVTIASTTAAPSGEFPVVFEKQYGEMPLSVVLKEGQYSVSVISGSNETFSTTSPTYYAAKNATIEIGHTTDVNLTATIRSYLVDIVYSEDFKKAFTDYYIEAHVLDERFTFAEMGDQIGYFAPGSVKLVLRGTTAAGSDYSSVIKEISSAGRERYVLTLAIRPQGHAFDVTVDTKVEQIGVNGSVDPDLYPDLPPAVIGDLTFNETDPQVVTGANTQVTVGALVAIEGLELTFTDANVTDAGLEANRVYNLTVAEDVAALTAAGVEFAPTIIGQRTGAINFAKLGTKLLSHNSIQTAYPVTIKVTDKVQKSIVHSATIKINPPVFTINATPKGNCWTKEATVNRTITASQGNVDQINARGVTYQYSIDQTNWLALDSDNLSGLTPATTYYVRAIYRDITSSTTSFSTEEPRQIPNSDFESWQDTRETNAGQQFYRWAKDGQEWWSSLNTLTCATPGYDYWYVSQSSSRTATGRNGLGVLMHTAGYGKANTWAGYLWSAAIYNVTAGKLFLGTYSGEQKNGKEFNSRPTAVTYWYKYAPHPDQGDKSITRIWVENRTDGTTTIIGEGSFAVTSNVNSYTQNRINIAYSNTTLPATHICMEFMAGVNQGEKIYLYDKTYDSPPFANQYYYYGSRFWLDDVELIYDK